MPKYIVEECSTGAVWIMDNESNYDILIAHRSKISLDAIKKFLTHLDEEQDKNAHKGT